MSSGRSWWSMWPAGPTTWRCDVGDDVQPLVELGLGVAVAPPDADVGAVALDPEQRRRDPLPELEPLVDLGDERAHPLVVRRRRGGARSSPLPVGPDHCAGEPGGAVGAQQRIGLASAGRRPRRGRGTGAAASASSARRATWPIRPGACERLRARHAEAFEVDEAADLARAARRRRAWRRCRPCCGRAGRSARARRPNSASRTTSRSPRYSGKK